MRSEKKFAENLARKAGTLLKKKFGEKRHITYKGEINIVTDADKMSEDLIVKEISRNFPQHGILTEESPSIAGTAPARWIIDPLDGTTNYAHRFPFFCVSIALEIEGIVRLGVIYDPLREELYSGLRGAGSYLNGQKLKVSSVANLSQSLLATGFPYDLRETRNNNLNYFNAMAIKAQAIRRAGAAALDLAYLAAGRFDGFWELKLKPWDTAAGVLLVVEAGGEISEISGTAWKLSSPDLLASNGLVHKNMLEILQSAKNQWHFIEEKPRRIS
ncbi:MAG TPA: inositol monophosphatase family protein [Smithellaceae bacterium]|nr:inositol monophosphatase family protein [Smithellaceae bacterium]HRS89434.1 inositol monophosphatase family protein [Smithellaceae bacterium]HRV26157.1 inositol monophosphatase family protein [Smithellaceae bacterium]